MTRCRVRAELPRDAILCTSHTVQSGLAGSGGITFGRFSHREMGARGLARLSKLLILAFSGTH
jgi:hypothetical protein